MEPITFAGCFGWLHDGDGDVGVVLCGGLGTYAQNGHVPLRNLARRLAQAGYPTLRFDYASTGDSCDASETDLPAAWLASVHAAADWLRTSAGVERIVLCGLHLGATLAVLAALERDDVHALVLMAPVVSGRRYVHELSLAAELNRDAPEQEEGWLESDGLRLPDNTLRSLRRLNLLAIPSRPASRVLVLDSSASSLVSDLAAHMRTVGADITRGSLGQLIEFDDNGHAAPQVELDYVLEWLGTVGARNRGLPPARPSRACDHGLRAEEWVEQPLTFGPANELFGLLCRPAEASRSDFVLLLGNSGVGPHHGYARFHVQLARRLAASGIASMRIDFAGLGDSLPVPDDAASHVYETDRSPDFAAAVDVLWRMGYRRFAVAGHCSGAYHAFNFSLSDPRVSALLMLNLTTFTWQKGQSFGRFLQDNKRSTRSYVAVLRRKGGWQRLLRGELNVGRALWTLQGRAQQRLALTAGRLARRVGVRAAPATPLQAMRTLAARGVRILLLVGTGDAGLDTVSAHLGPDGRHLAALSGAQILLLPGLDHLISRRQMQEAAMEGVIDFLSKSIFREVPTHASRRVAAE